MRFSITGRTGNEFLCANLTGLTLPKHWYDYFKMISKYLGLELSPEKKKALNFAKDEEKDEVKISEVGIAGIPSRATLDFLTGEVRTEGSQYYIVDDGACDAVEGKAVGSSLLVPEADVQDEWDPSDEHTHDFLYGYITVTCKVKNTKTGKYLVGSDSEFKTVYIPYTALFEAGKSYNFVLNFDGTNGFGYDEDGEPATRLIRYKVNVTDWQIAGDDNDAKVRI